MINCFRKAYFSYVRHDIANFAFGYVDQVALMLAGMGSSADVFRMVRPIFH